MSSERRFDVHPDSRIRASFASAQSARLVWSTVRVPMTPARTAGWKPLPRQRCCPLHPLVLHGCIAWHRRFFRRENWNGWRKKQELHWPLPHDFCVNLHQDNPLKLVVLRPVWVLIANWLAGVNEFWHHWRDGTDAGMELRRLRRHSVKECQREDGMMRSTPWYISLRRNT